MLPGRKKMWSVDALADACERPFLYNITLNEFVYNSLIPLFPISNLNASHAAQKELNNFQNIDLIFDGYRIPYLLFIP